MPSLLRGRVLSPTETFGRHMIANLRCCRRFDLKPTPQKVRTTKRRKTLLLSIRFESNASEGPDDKASQNCCCRFDLKPPLQKARTTKRRKTLLMPVEVKATSQKPIQHEGERWWKERGPRPSTWAPGKGRLSFRRCLWPRSGEPILFVFKISAFPPPCLLPYSSPLPPPSRV